MMTVLTFKIIEPKFSVHLNPSINHVQEIQVIYFVRVRKPFVRKQNMTWHIFKVEDDGSETELLRFNVPDQCPIEEMQELFNKLDKRFYIIEVAGDWYIKSRKKLRLTKGLYSEVGVPEILEKGVPYPLLWNNSDGQRFLMHCDTVEKLSSCDNIGGSAHISTPSKLLAVVLSQHYPVLRTRSHQRSFLNDFDLSITNIDGNVPTFGKNLFIITLKIT